MKCFKVPFIIISSLLWFSALFGGVNAAPPSQPLTTDSRIKTLIYNENDVYRLVIHFGYQSSIEFGKGEEVQTISLGDSYSWKITPVGRRIFIKTMEPNAHTNMTVITNKRTYEFDLITRLPEEKVDEELIYVLRFYYPENNKSSFKQPIDGAVPAFPAMGMPPLPPVPGGYK
jgi:type IV secretion system protein VirB9